MRGQFDQMLKAWTSGMWIRSPGIGAEMRDSGIARCALSKRNANGRVG